VKLFAYKNRDEYLRAQIERSIEKREYCKVYFADVIRYRIMLGLGQNETEAQQRSTKTGFKILCLGVRSGAEIDLFRATFFGPLLRLKLIQNFASRQDDSRFGLPKTKLAKRLGFGSGSPSDGKVIGVELNPEIQREDIWTGSFDKLPLSWTGKFDLIYSNSIDHSQNPRETVAEWKRVASPGAYIVLAFTESKEISVHDPLAGLNYQTLVDLWQAPVVFYSDTFNRNGYSEICFRL
jgi:hypothetical protein